MLDTLIFCSLGSKNGMLTLGHRAITSDLENLSLHAPYITSDNVIISDDTGIMIQYMGSFTLSFLAKPLLFHDVLQVPTMSKKPYPS